MGCRGQWPLRASAVAGEPSGRTFYFRSRLEKSGEKKEILWPEWTRTRRGHCVFAGILKGWRQVGANNVGWPTVNGKFMSNLRYRKEWWAYQQTFHSIAEDDLATQNLREKYLNDEVKQKDWQH
jgi:hypothetical protein